MKAKLFIIFILTTLSLNAQYTNLNWAFGDSCGIKFSSTGIDSMYRTSVKSRGSCASVSDSLGNLIFYASAPHYQLTTNGAQLAKGVLFNSIHQVVPNGDSLNARGWYRELIIIPWPDHYKQFYVFKTGVTMFDLNYSKVDMNQNNGLGYCIQKNVLHDTGLIADGLAAIKHGNGRDWWLLYRKWDTGNNEYFVTLITPIGISPPIIQAIGNPVYAGFNRIIPSPDGNSIMCIANSGLLTQLDFDRCTGFLSNEREYNSGTVVIPEFQFWDGAFSSDGSKFYSTTGDTTCYLYQFNLNQPMMNVFNTRILIDSIDSFNYAGTAIRLAPDNRIYTSTWYNDNLHNPYPYPDTLFNTVNTHLGVINYPDSLGLACNYNPLSVYLGGTRTYIGLPNNPDYTLGKLVNSICDTLTSLPQIHPPPEKPFIIRTNPFTNSLELYNTSSKSTIANVKIINSLGAVISQLNWNTNELLTINSTIWKEGMYYFQITTQEIYQVIKGVKAE